MFFLVLLLFCTIVNAQLSPALSLSKCKSGDDVCATNVVKVAFPLILKANAEIGAEDMDPMFHSIIEGNLSILKFRVENTTVIGFKLCELQNAKYSEEPETLKVDFLCPRFSLKGQYKINGRLLMMDVEGEGDYTSDTKKYRIKVDMDIKTFIGEDGKTYKNIKSFKFETDPLENVHYDFKNLFNGRKDLGDALLKFANENWKAVAYVVQEPVFRAHIKKIVKNVNKNLNTTPIN